MIEHHIYLIPGFFGFDRLGDLRYFYYAKEALERSFKARNVHAKVFSVDTLPVASIAKRAKYLWDNINKYSSSSNSIIHLIGHSTGGLDARLITSPSYQYIPEHRKTDIFLKIKNVITFATPHYGTPIAGFFTTAYGKSLLQTLSLLTAKAAGQIPSEFFALGIGILRKLERKAGIYDSLLSQFSQQLLDDFTDERRVAVLEMMSHINSDQGALLQLTPEAMDIFNATVFPSQNISYYSYINASPKPKAIPSPETVINPRMMFSYLMHKMLWDIVSEYHPNYGYYSPTIKEKKLWESQLGFSIDQKTNDAIVPILSMVYGNCRGAWSADHLDVVGHYGRPSLHECLADWLRTGAGFSEKNFDKLYNDMTDVLIG